MRINRLSKVRLTLLSISTIQEKRAQLHNNWYITTVVLMAHYGLMINAETISLPFNDVNTSQFWLVSIVLFTVSLSLPVLYVMCLAFRLAKKCVCSCK